MLKENDWLRGEPRLRLSHDTRCLETGWGEPELKNRLEVDEVALVLPIHRFEGTAPKSDPKVGPKKCQWIIDNKKNQ